MVDHVVLRRVLMTMVIAFSFAATLYTTNGCGGPAYAPRPRVDPGVAALGTVTNSATGAPIDDARVRFEQPGGIDVVMPAFHGKFGRTFGLRALAATVTISAPHFRTRTEVVTLHDGDNQFTFALTPDE